MWRLQPKNHPSISICFGGGRTIIIDGGEGCLGNFLGHEFFSQLQVVQDFFPWEIAYKCPIFLHLKYDLNCRFSSCLILVPMAPLAYFFPEVFVFGNCPNKHPSSKLIVHHLWRSLG